MRTRAVVIATTVVVVSGAVLLAVVTRDGTPTAGGATAPSAMRWRTFSSAPFELTVRYPSSWRAATYTEGSTFSAAVVFFSDQPMASPCRTSAGSRQVSCTGGAVEHLAPGGTSLNWFNESSTLPHLFASSPGTRTTVDGVPATVLIGAASECIDIGGRTSITATVERPDAASNVYVMSACIAAGRHSRQVALVLASLRTMRQH